MRPSFLRLTSEVLYIAFVNCGMQLTALFLGPWQITKGSTVEHDSEAKDRTADPFRVETRTDLAHAEMRSGAPVRTAHTKRASKRTRYDFPLPFGSVSRIAKLLNVTRETVTTRWRRGDSIVALAVMDMARELERADMLAVAKRYEEIRRRVYDHCSAHADNMLHISSFDSTIIDFTWRTLRWTLEVVPDALGRFDPHKRIITTSPEHAGYNIVVALTGITDSDMRAQLVLSAVLEKNVDLAWFFLIRAIHNAASTTAAADPVNALLSDEQYNDKYFTDNNNMFAGSAGE